MVYLSQSYYGVPKLIRLQAQYVILKKLSSQKDLKLILSEYGFGYSLDEMEKIYEEATQKKENFLLLDLETDNKDKIRFNWTVVHPKKEEYKVNSDKVREKNNNSNKKNKITKNSNKPFKFFDNDIGCLQ